MRERGHTLIELLLVIAIIGIATALLLPSLAQAQRAARRAVCLTELKSYAVAPYEPTGGLVYVIPASAKCINCHRPTAQPQKRPAGFPADLLVEELTR